VDYRLCPTITYGNPLTSTAMGLSWISSTLGAAGNPRNTWQSANLHCHGLFSGLAWVSYCWQSASPHWQGFVYTWQSANIHRHGFFSGLAGVLFYGKVDCLQFDATARRCRASPPSQFPPPRPASKARIIRNGASGEPRVRPLHSRPYRL